MRLFTFFPNLITKESYNWWVTRRFWGFRQQISKAKYLKISQNIGGKYQEALGEHHSTVQNGYFPIRVDAIKWSGYVRLEKLKLSPFLSGIRIPDVNIRGEVRGSRVQMAPTSGCKWRPHPGANGGSRVQMAAHIPGANPIQICGPDALRWCIRTPCPGILLAWIPKNSPQSWIALVIKKLSKHQNLAHFD